MREMKSKLFKNIPVTIPSVPNFIKVGEHMYPVKDFTEEELIEIAEMWKKELIAKSKIKNNVNK